MKAIVQCLCILATSVVVFGRSETLAQSDVWTAGDGPGLNWTTPGNWDQMTVPNSNFHDFAIVGSTVSGIASPTGIANVTTDIRVSNPSPSVTLGNGANTSGTLNISATGGFRTAVGALTTGDFNVGLTGGTGFLNVASGGVLEVAGNLATPTNANVASTISLAGTASATAGSGFLDRTLIVDGSNVNFSVTTNLILGLAGTHTWRIPATGPSVLQVGGNADLGGTLRVEFPGGGTPAIGSTWNLIDAATIDANEVAPSSFTNYDDSAVPGLGPGQNFRVRSVANGATRRFAQLVLEQHPILSVNRNTGEVTISNPGAVPTVDFDVYQVQSALGALNPANWISLDPVGGWLEANPTPNALSEIVPVGSATIAATTTISLGNVFAPPQLPFGVENEDITLQFAVPGEGYVNAEVTYTGLPTNTLTLNVDPSTGAVQIVNGSNSTVLLDTYTISSASGSLRFADGNPADTWNSLEDQGTSNGNWFEANTSANQIAELLITGGLEIGPNATVDLGSPFNDASGVQDLTFQFSILTDGLPGDFNADGIVDAIDYTVWRDNLNNPDDSVLNGNGDATPGVGLSDYGLWKASYGSVSAGGGTPELLTGKLLYGSLISGSGSVASNSTVPEPSAAALIVIGFSLVTSVLSRRNDARTDIGRLCRMATPGGR